jgi:hypothetical protein
MIVIRSGARVSGEHAKPGRALASGHSTLAGRRAGAQHQQCRAE